jgi:hypothetical protein
MKSTEIDEILRRVCKDTFVGVFARDQLPTVTRRPALLVVNTDPHNRPGEHWTAIYLGVDGYGEFFDSLGLRPNKTVENYMNRHCLRWIRNYRQLQSIVSHFCGYYCVFYCCYRNIGFDLNVITSWFTNDTMLNCMSVHEFVCRRLKNKM